MSQEKYSGLPVNKTAQYQETVVFTDTFKGENFAVREIFENGQSQGHDWVILNDDGTVRWEGESGYDLDSAINAAKAKIIELNIAWLQDELEQYQ